MTFGVPAFFGTRQPVDTPAKPVAMDVTFVYSNASGNTNFINGVRTASNIAAFNTELTAAGIGQSLVNRYSMASFEYDIHSVFINPQRVLEREIGFDFSNNLIFVVEPDVGFGLSVTGNFSVDDSGGGGGTLPAPLAGAPYRLFNSGTNASGQRFYRVLDATTSERINLGFTSFGGTNQGELIPPAFYTFRRTDLRPDNAYLWVEAGDISRVQWSDARNVASLGANDKDETGAIYNIAAVGRSHQTLVSNLYDNWPSTTDSWPSGQTPSGPVIDGSYRSRTSNVERVIISTSIGESGSDDAIVGTYGIANGPVGADYNLDNQGPSAATDNNTNLLELDNAMQNASLKQRLVFIDTEAVSCSETADLIATSIIPSGYLEVGVIFPNSVYATVIYGPPSLINASINDIRVVGNLSNTTITAAGISDGWGTVGKTNTGHYALITNGGVFIKSRLDQNLSLAFQLLGRTVGQYLYDTSF